MLYGVNLRRFHKRCEAVGRSSTRARCNAQPTTLCSTAASSKSFRRSGCSIVPADDRVRLFVALRSLRDQRPHLLGPRLQLMLPHQFVQDQPQRDPFFGLRTQCFLRKIHAFGTDTTVFHFRCRSRRKALRFGLDQRLRDGDHPRSHAARSSPGPSSRSLSCDRLRAQVGADLRAQFIQVAAGDAEALANSASIGGSTGSLVRTDRQFEIRRLALDFLAMIVHGKYQRKRFVVAGIIPRNAASNSGSIQPSPSTIAKSLPARPEN